MSFLPTLRNVKTGEDPPNETASSHPSSISSRGREILSSSSSFHANERKYDVFLSFRGEDTRRNFTDHLYAALLRKRLKTFRDDKKLIRGELITAEISKAIQESKSSLIVFSRNYAFSSWCLEELVQIVECNRRRGHHIFPIFYDVDPSAVRKQTRSFRKAFDKHKRTFWWDKSKLQNWRSALVEVANISGWNAKDRLESELIEEVVQNITLKLKPMPSNSMELAEIDWCLETLNSYIASTIFLHTKHGWKDQVGYSSAKVGRTYSSTGEGSYVQRRATFSSEADGDSTNQRYQMMEEHVRQLKNSLLENFPLQLLLQATDNFSPNLIVGRGGFCVVYRALLDDDFVVAVKRRSAPGKYGDKAFLQELELLSRIHHKNIVRLSGFHVDHFERILVFEYQGNDSLFDHLFVLPNSRLNSSWAARLNAALDIARGLEYLHEYAVPPIIHRDVKSSNILFDSEWTAKVGDFGLALVVPLSSEVDCEVCGTRGYMDPEYYKLQQVTTKSDVYGFGVVLLELLAGQMACRMGENQEVAALVDLVVPDITQGKIQNVLDQRVTPPTSLEMEVLCSIGELAVDCVNPQSRFRPTISEVMKCLVKASSAIV